MAGSRSRDLAYLEVIEKILVAQPALVHYRLLFGPPRNTALHAHLGRLLELRDPTDRSLGMKTLHIGLIRPEQDMPERFFVASEHAAVVPIPSLTSAYGFDSGVLLGAQSAARLLDHARQCYAADLYFAYYEQTGARAYFERGVAALRATFAVAPYENWAHRLEDVHGSWTGIHWGTGSAITSVLLARPRYGDAFVDARAGWGVGIDGCTIDAVRLEGDRLAVTLRAAFPSGEHRHLVVRSDRALQVSVNGRELGHFPPDALAAGIPVSR